jgi:hypothetical protein
MKPPKLETIETIPFQIQKSMLNSNKSREACVEKIKTTAQRLFPLLGIFLALYVTITAWGTLEFALGAPDLWMQSPWVEPGAQIALATRLAYAALWLLPVMAGLIAVGAAMGLLWQVRKGIVFAPRIATGFRTVGLGCAGSGVLDHVANLFTPTILSWHNPSGPFAPNFYFNSEAAGLVLCGGGFYLTGWIMTEAIRLKSENEGFI